VYALVQPTPLADPRLVVASPHALSLLGLDPDQVRVGERGHVLLLRSELRLHAPQHVPHTVPHACARTHTANHPQAERPELVSVLAGNVVLSGQGSRPAGHCYAGFQFGSFAGQLGDGAAIYLGEVRGAERVGLRVAAEWRQGQSVQAMQD
jgi:uncharacterized protein YdiU (UPF0061 family)